MFVVIVACFFSHLTAALTIAMASWLCCVSPHKIFEEEHVNKTKQKNLSVKLLQSDIDP